MSPEPWGESDFKAFVRKCIDKQRNIAPSRIVLKSFYFGEVKKPKNVTIKQFDWLRSIAENESQTYKSK